MPRAQLAMNAVRCSDVGLSLCVLFYPCPAAHTAELMPDERITLSSKLCPWDTHTRNMHLTPAGAPSEDGDGNGTGQA
jgi:hypothetical protein